MGNVHFTVAHEFEAPPAVLWASMLDWQSHGEWIPATRVEIDGGDAKTVGSTFTGFTGYGPLTLVDRMRLSEIEWDPSTKKGSCTVEKLGPVLKGQAGFTVMPSGAGSTLDWFEDVSIPYLPQLLAPLVNKLSAAGFKFGMRRLAKSLADK